MGAEYPLKVIIQGVDRLTAPLRAINDRIKKLTAPARRLGESLRNFANESGITRIAGAFGGVGKAIGGVTSEVWNLGRRLTLLGGVAAFGLFSIVNSATAAGDALGEAAARAGMTVDAYSEYQYAAAKAGVETEQFATGIDRFNASLGELRMKRGPLLGFLKSVSPSLAAQLKQTKNTAQALDVIFDALERQSDPGKRAAMARAAFGKSGFGMAEIGRQGVAVAQLRAEYQKLVGSQQEFADGAGKMDDAMRETSLAFMGARNAMMAELFPALIELAGAFRDFLVENRGDVRAWARDFAKEVLGFAKALPGHLRDLNANLRGLRDLLEPVARLLGGWPNLLGAIAAAIVGGPLLAAMASLVSAFVSLGIAMGATPFGWFMLGLAALAGAAVVIYKNWEPIKTYFQRLFEDIGNAIGGLTDMIVGLFTLDFARMGSGFKNMLSGFGGIAMATPLGLGARALGFGPPLGAQAAAPGPAAPQRADVGGVLKIEIDAEGNPRVRDLKSNSPGFTIDVWSGPIMVVP